MSRQRQSRLEEAKVEKRQEDEDFLARHPEIGAAIRVISRVGSITFDLAIILWKYICVTCEQELLQHQPEQPLSRVVDVVLDTGFEERVAREREKILNK